MAQGMKKAGKAKTKSGGAQKRKATIGTGKGWKTCHAKGRKAIEGRDDIHTSKVLARKTEAYLAGKAISKGTRFFLNDVKDVGKKALDVVYKERNKKEDREKKMNERLKDQLRKLGRDVWECYTEVTTFCIDWTIHAKDLTVGFVCLAGRKQIMLKESPQLGFMFHAEPWTHEDHNHTHSLFFQ